MTRTTKKVLYGIFYLAVLVLLGLSVFGKPAERTPQDETLNASPLKIVVPAEFFPLGDSRSVVLARIFNPNTGYASPEFSYLLKFYGSADRLIGEKNGKDFIYASETKYLFELADVPYSGIERVVLEFSQIKWEKAEIFTKPSVSVVNATTTLSSRGFEVGGTIVNESSLELKEAKVLTVVFDKFGYLLSGYQTLISALPSGERRSFLVVIPADQTLADRIDPSETKIVISAR